LTYPTERARSRPDTATCSCAVMWACRRIEARLLVTAVRGAGRPAVSAAGSRPVGQAHAQGAELPRRGVNSAGRSPPVGAGQGTRHGDGAAASLLFHLPRQAIRPDYERRGVRARRCTGAVRRCARFDHQRAWLPCGFSPRISYSQINQPRIGPDAEPLVFRSFVDHVPAASQSVGTAWVSCAVTRSGQGPRNLAAMMTRRDVTARASDASVVVVYPWARSGWLVIRRRRARAAHTKW
jgi:hypothetical protein